MGKTVFLLPLFFPGFDFSISLFLIFFLPEVVSWVTVLFKDRSYFYVSLRFGTIIDIDLLYEDLFLIPMLLLRCDFAWLFFRCVLPFEAFFDVRRSYSDSDEEEEDEEY